MNPLRRLVICRGCGWPRTGGSGQ